MKGFIKVYIQKTQYTIAIKHITVVESLESGQAIINITSFRGNNILSCDDHYESVLRQIESNRE